MSINIRRGTPPDGLPCHSVMWRAVNDLAHRRNLPLDGTAEEWWAGGSQAEFTYLARAAAEWWVAEETSAGQIVGYARSLLRGGLFELTEFFVEPSEQSKGAGRALLERAFPADRGEVRSIIATTDVRAQARYYAAGVAARFPMFTLTGAPRQSADVSGTLEVLAVKPTVADHQADFEAVERRVLGFVRGAAELGWILEHREGYLYRRDGQVVGYAFVGREGAGPIGALTADDLPALLLHVETRAHALGVERLSLQVPGINATAVRHLTQRGFQLDAWINLLMSNRPFGEFDRFVAFSPLFL